MTPHLPDSDEFAYAVATQGPSAFETEITRLAHAAHDRGMSAEQLDLLLDRSMPEVLRQRTLGAALRLVAAAP